MSMVSSVDQFAKLATGGVEGERETGFNVTPVSQKSLKKDTIMDVSATGW